MAGISSATLNNVYNYYLTTYAPHQSSSRYDTHKKSELKGVYNSIVKLSKDSPLYLSVRGSGAREFAIGVKENARSLHNTIASLGGTEESDVLNKKSAYSSDDSILTAEFIGDNPDEAESFQLEVESLATGQQNLGKFLINKPTDLPADTYSFDMNINDLNYEFQFNVNEGESNKDIQTRIERLINNANIGLKADLLENDEGDTSLRISSNSTGLPEDKDFIFKISDANTSKASGAVDYLGLGFTSRMPGNASFLLDGEEYHSYSNEFIVGGQFRIHLLSADPDKSVSVGLKTDMESLAGNISQLVSGYNSFIKAAAEFTGKQGNAAKLTREMGRIAGAYRNDLSGFGLAIEEDGTISIDEDVLKKSSLEPDSKADISGIRGFANSLIQKTNQVSLDPMQYVDKKIAAYKNPNGINFPNPYITSAYSGMMFNSYC
ncbi:MAG: flagellar capping protein [Lachnospiraceae bacterium]|nr:flagellar capping protein [Lachnospiraceae bacterium]